MGSPQAELLQEEGDFVPDYTHLNTPSLKMYGWTETLPCWEDPIFPFCWCGTHPHAPERVLCPSVIAGQKWWRDVNEKLVTIPEKNFEQASKKWMCFLLIWSVHHISWRSTKQATCRLLLVQAQQFWLWEKKYFQACRTQNLLKAF